MNQTSKISDRKTHYIRKGVIFTNARILFTDLLSSLVCRELVSKVFVFESQLLLDVRTLLPTLLILQSTFLNFFNLTDQPLRKETRQVFSQSKEASVHEAFFFIRKSQFICPVFSLLKKLQVNCK